jgi:thiol:disulfide interchange protein
MTTFFPKYLKIFLTFLTLILSISSWSQGLEFPEDKVKATFSIEQNGCEATLIAKVTIVPKWHINAFALPKDSFLYPTSIVLKKSKSFELVGKVVEPKPHYMRDELADEDLYYHEGTVTFKQKIKILSKEKFTIDGTFEFQTCNDVRCLPSHASPFSVKAKACAAAAAAVEAAPIVPKVDEEKAEEVGTEEKADTLSTQKAEKKSVDLASNLADPNEKEKKDNSSIWVIFGLSFLSGLMALLTPCVFPMIPMTVSFFTKQSRSKAEGIKNALIYGVSIIVIYILLGTVVTAMFGAEALNEMSTNPTFNIIFFIILVIFAVSFLGAFEIRLPSSWLNKADSRADKGGLVGIFFMALALALVSFSCTGPIVGTLLVQAANEGGLAPLIGMLGFSLALALPFALFAAFPGWMNTLPKSGGWLNTIKVVLGFLELALAFKFLSNADLSLQSHFLEREVFLAIWIGIFLILTIYLFGWIQLPHDSKLENLSVGRTLFGVLTLTFVIYMIPGMFGAPLKMISAFPPPMSYSESPLGFGGGGTQVSENQVEGTHLGPQNIMVFHDYDLALAHAKKVGKPLFVDFTGHNCVNCRRMEQSVWGEPGIIDILRNDVVIVSLHVDERIDLPKSEQKTVEIAPGKFKDLVTTGDKWMFKQISQYKVTAQPYYVLVSPDGEDYANGSADYEHHSAPAKFKRWLDDGLNLHKSAK